MTAEAPHAADESLLATLGETGSAAAQAVTDYIDALEAQLRLSATSAVVMIVYGVAGALLLVGAWGVVVAACVTALTLAGLALPLALGAMAMLQIIVAVMLLFAGRRTSRHLRVRPPVDQGSAAVTAQR